MQAPSCRTLIEPHRVFQERPSPLRPWCISPMFQISPLFSTNFHTLWKMLPFPEKNSNFHSPKFLMTFWFFSHPPRISPYFSCFRIFPPCFAKFIISPYFQKCSPLFSKNSPAFYILYVHFVFPLLWPWCIYASPNARTGRLLHLFFRSKTRVLDRPPGVYPTSATFYLVHRPTAFSYVR